MIFGNEGMPGSGKSLDAMQHILDSLLAGRTVITNINGVDLKAIADYLSMPLPTVQRLLVVIAPPEGMPEDDKVGFIKSEFLARQVPDSLWIWDEINQFWPPDRQPLPADWAKFVTEHRHLGIDVLIMGQDLSELHATWRKRLQRYTRFTKLDMQGKDDSFHWGSYTNVGKNRYKRMADGKKPYNKAFFPLYKSVRDVTSNLENYRDNRFAVFQPKHKFYAACFALLLCYSLYEIWSFFNPDLEQSSSAVAAEMPKSEKAATPAKPASKPADSEPASGDSEQPEQPPERQPIDYLDRFAQQYDLRLTGIIDRKEPVPGKPAFEFSLDFVDESYRVKERMNRKDVASLGWAIERHPYGILISKDGVSHVARGWPLDNWGKVPQQTLTSIKPEP
jgi:zona occludens toxin